MIGIIKYKTGNVKSIESILNFLSVKNKIITSTKDNFKSYKGLILPGVGSMDPVMKYFNSSKTKDNLFEQIINKKMPILGICLGMQVLFQSSEESNHVQCLSLLEGITKKISNKKKYQHHVGWNKVKLNNSLLAENIKNNSYFYFNHTYSSHPQKEEITKGVTYYKRKISSIVEEKNIFGLQFHPERSLENGNQIFSNFVRICNQW